MPHSWPRALKRFLRLPAVIVGEILVITAACVLGASLPQAGRSPVAEVAHLREHGAFFSALVEGLALDHVFTSAGFLCALGMATASLAIVVAEQIRRLRAGWTQELTEAHFRNAPFRHTFSRPASPEAVTSTRIRSGNRLGLAGSPLFHTGLLCVILAGAFRALFGVDAMVDLYEGETLPPTVEAWGPQWPGPLGKPFRMDAPLVLTAVERSRYGSGELKGLRVKLAIQGPGGDQIHDLGVNEELRTSRGRLYTDASHGPAVLLEWASPSVPAMGTAVLLERKEPRAFGAYAQGPRNLRARLRVADPSGSARPTQVEIRILEGGSVLVEGVLKPGESLALPGGGWLRLHDLRYWARLHGNHDPALGPAYLGFSLALLGAALTYGVVKVDELVSITVEDGVEHVLLAMRPQRFVPLYRERFERLVRDHGGLPCE